MTTIEKNAHRIKQLKRQFNKAKRRLERGHGKEGDELTMQALARVLGYNNKKGTKHGNSREANM